VQGTLLYLRFPAFDPNRLLDRLSPWVAGCFTRGFLTLSAVLILSAFAITALEWEAILRDVRSLWRFDALLLAWVVVLGVTACHEFAHGLTCKHFGGEVREMGFMLIYFQPAFYCNVSDAGLFPERAKRLWVTFAGAYFEMFLWALATLTWRVVEGGTWVSFMATIVMATSAIKSFFNFNPLIKLDGYYLLSDYLEIPNLRQRAIGYVAARVQRLWRTTLPEIVPVSPRERRIFLFYGVLAAVYSYWLLGSIAVAFGRYLVDQYQGFGAVAFATLVASPFHARVKRLTGRVAAAAKTITPRPLKPSRMRTVAAFVLVAGILWFGRMELTVSGEFRVLPLHNADVRAEVDGLIDQIHVDEGSRVEAGAVIARLADNDLHAELEKTVAEMHEREADLKRLLAGARPEEIALAQSEAQTAATALVQLQARAQSAQQVRSATLAGARNAVEKAATRVTYADADMGRARALVEHGLISRQQLEQTQVELDVRRQELEEARAALAALMSDDLTEIRGALAVAEQQAAVARAKLTLLLAGSRREDIEVVQAALDGLEARRRLLEADVA
ncbi:MAG: biotin/lipoyl-binding protein, partial [Longimicrobiales bacterium]